MIESAAADGLKVTAIQHTTERHLAIECVPA